VFVSQGKIDKNIPDPTPSTWKLQGTALAVYIFSVLRYKPQKLKGESYSKTES